MLKVLLDLITKATLNQSVGLLTIGGSMLICSLLAESRIAGALSRELVQALVIGAGLGATVILFRSREGGHQR
jgi:hypothetical protein